MRRFIPFWIGILISPALADLPPLPSTRATKLDTANLDIVYGLMKVAEAKVSTVTSKDLESSETLFRKIDRSDFSAYPTVGTPLERALICLRKEIISSRLGIRNAQTTRNEVKCVLVTASGQHLPKSDADLLKFAAQAIQ